MLCIVCNKKTAEIFKIIESKQYWKCKECLAIFLDKKFYLEPIDEQLLATLTGQTSFVDPAVEEQFKINY